ncbi:hypothetical protein FRC03_000765 [Tulasnella sp. 419]|nr:hypothetical protein FRC03_000765 [Tulasnella sp. 419]
MISRILNIQRFFGYSAETIGTEAEEDLVGARCVTWLWEHRSPDPGDDDSVLDVAGDLNAFDIAANGQLCRMMTTLLKPSWANGVIVSLNVESSKLRSFLEPLSRWIALRPSDPPYYFEETEREDAPFFSLWRLLGAKFWQLIIQCPNDEVAIRLISSIVQVVDVLYGRFKWCLSSEEDQKCYMHNAVLIQDHLSNIVARSPFNPILIDYLTILGCIYWGCSQSQRSCLLSLDSAINLRRALVSTLTIDGSPDKEQWRGRLRLLSIQEMPDSSSSLYASLRDVPDDFSRSLGRWLADERSINLRWVIRWLRTNRYTPVRLYHAAIQLLLIKNHALWYPNLDKDGHFQVNRRLMNVQGTSLFYTWQWKGKKVVPLESILAVWHHHYIRNPTSVEALTYLEPEWVQSITVAASQLGSTPFVPIPERAEFPPNMMESESLMTMMVSLREYLRVIVSNGLSTRKKINTLVESYQGIARVFEDWSATTFVDKPEGYDEGFWRNEWRGRLRSEAQLVEQWYAGLADEQV